MAFLAWKATGKINQFWLLLFALFVCLFAKACLLASSCFVAVMFLKQYIQTGNTNRIKLLNICLKKLQLFIHVGTSCVSKTYQSKLEANFVHFTHFLKHHKMWASEMCNKIYSFFKKYEDIL